MPHHHRTGLNDGGVGPTDAMGNILIQLVWDAAADIVGLETIEVLSHWSWP